MSAADRPGRLAGRIALVTGASRGIGAAAARALAGAGAHVILVARTQGGLEELDDAIRAAGGTATLAPLDLTDFTKIDEMAFAVAQRFGRLDILVGNAGMLGGLYPVGHMPPGLFDGVQALNVTANWRLIRAFDAPLRVSEGGRAIFVTAGVAGEVRPYWGPYAASKAALEALVRAYAGEITLTRIRANLLDPGVVATNLRRQAYPGEDPASLPAADSLAPHFLALADPDCRLQGAILRVRRDGSTAVG